MLSHNYKYGILTVALLSLLISSCSGQDIKPENIVKYVPSPEVPQSTLQHDYILEPGDVIKVEFYYISNMNRQVTIRRDGKITLPLKGELDAAGLTPLELKDKITELFSDVLKDPAVTVVVEGYNKNNIVYVMGEVQKPDYFTLESPTTLTQILARAGVSMNTANLETVLVVSRDEKGKPVGKLVNVGSILRGAGVEYDVLLKKYDIVYVSKTAIAEVDLFVEQYINRIVPNFFRFGYTIGRGESIND